MPAGPPPRPRGHQPPFVVGPGCTGGGVGGHGLRQPGLGRGGGRRGSCTCPSREGVGQAWRVKGSVNVGLDSPNPVGWWGLYSDAVRVIEIGTGADHQVLRKRGNPQTQKPNAPSSSPSHSTPPQCGAPTLKRSLGQGHAQSQFEKIAKCTKMSSKKAIKLMLQNKR